MKKAVILLGAGAPLSWGSPSCKAIEEAMFAENEFMVQDDNGEKSLALFIKEQIISHTKCPEDYVNFEHIINTLEFLIDYDYEFFSSVNPRFIGTRPIWVKPDEAIWEKLRNFRIELIRDDTYHVFNNAKKSDSPVQREKNNVTRSYLISALKHYLGTVTRLISRYDNNAHILQDQYGSLNKNMVEFYSFLKEQGFSVRFYTTNYDNFFPRILANVHTVFNGFQQSGEFADVKTILRDQKINCYYNLHGSIYWENAPDTKTFGYSFAYRADYPFSYPDYRSTMTNPSEFTSIFNIVTGFNKLQKTTVEPISAMFTSLANDCANCDLIATVGYSYSDIHINRILKYAKSFGAKKFFHITYVRNHELKGGHEFNGMHNIVLNNTELATLAERDGVFSTEDNNNFIFHQGFSDFLINKRWLQVFNK